MRKGIYSSTYPTNFHEIADRIKNLSCEEAISDLPKSFDLNREISQTRIQAMTTPLEESRIHYEKLRNLYSTRIQQSFPENDILGIINDYAEYTHYKKLCQFYTSHLSQIIEATKQRKEAAAKGGEARSNKSKEFAAFIRELVELTRPDNGWLSTKQFLDANIERIEQENSLRKFNYVKENLRKTLTKWINSGKPLPELKITFESNQRKSEK